MEGNSISNNRSLKALFRLQESSLSVTSLAGDVCVGPAGGRSVG